MYYGETILYYGDNLELVGGSSVCLLYSWDGAVYSGGTVFYYGRNLDLRGTWRDLGRVRAGYLGQVISSQVSSSKCAPKTGREQCDIRTEDALVC